MLNHLYNSFFNSAPKFLKPFFGPNLYRYHGSTNVPAFNYKASSLETFCSNILGKQKWAIYAAKYYLTYRIIWRLFNLTSSILPASLETLQSFTKLFFGCMVISWFVLGLSRISSPVYMNFLEVLQNPNSLTEIKKYDFDMIYWPTDYKATSDCRPENKVILRPIKDKPFNPAFDYLCSGLGRWLIMPGSLAVVNAQLSWQLNQYRSKILEQFNDSKRVKIELDNSGKTFIDSIYIPGTDSTLKKKIVICSEGNAGFYEVGILSAPFRKGYSVFGWNRPGFGQSFGQCNVENERRAITAILEYVRGVLKYKDQDIIVYGWSIGGYPSAVAANAVNTDGEKIVSTMVLDATFDHITHLVGSVLPSFVVPIGVKLVKHGWDLDVDQELQYYTGDILFYRRLRDEIISPGGPQRPDLNRINFLVLNHIQAKFDLKIESLPETEQVKCKNQGFLLARENLLSGGRLSRESQSKLRILQGQDKEVYDYFRHIFEDLVQGHNDPMPNDRFRVPGRSD